MSNLKNSSNKSKKPSDFKSQGLGVGSSEKTQKKLLRTTNSELQTTNKPESMADLLAMSSFRGYKRGDKVEGTVASIVGREVLIDIGGKMEGIVGEKEWEEVKGFVATLKVGDRVLTNVISAENEKGQMILSVRQAMQTNRWQVFFDLLKSGETVTVRPLEVNKGGLLADYSGIRGFIPISQLSADHQKNLPGLVNKPLDVKVIEVDKAQNRLVFSEKAITAAAEKEARMITLKEVKLGDNYKAKVVEVLSYGLLVSLELPADKLAEGLVHISEVAWGKTTDLASKYKIGDEVKVMAISVNDADGKLNLSIKQLTEDPFADAAKNYKVDQKIKGKVSHISNLGVYLTLEEGVEGLIPASKLPTGKSYEVGEDVTATVEAIDLKLRKITVTPVLTKKFVGYK